MTIMKSADAVADAAAMLRQGKLVAFPTETVYGLGANALDGQAVARIFTAKGRPQFNPVIVHFPDADSVFPYVEWTEQAQTVAASFWPGPLTMILPRAKACAVSELCSAGLPTLAVRVPMHKTAHAFLRKAGVPVAAPSANKSGSISPTTPILVAASLGDAVDFILADGPCAVGLESTVLDLTGDAPVVLRPGAVTAEQISQCLDRAVDYDLGTRATEGDRPRSPGQLLRHYAPKRPLRLNAVDLEPGEALLAFGSTRFMGIKGGGAARDLPAHAFRSLSDNGDLHEAAANMFRMLDELDKGPNRAIAVMNIPEQGIGIAINDRLRRAAQAAAL